jgi:hypothetical protein
LRGILLAKLSEKGVIAIPAKQVKKKPVSDNTKASNSAPGLLDQVLGIFRKKTPEPPPRRSPQREQPVPPP